MSRVEDEPIFHSDEVSNERYRSRRSVKDRFYRISITFDDLDPCRGKTGSNLRVVDIQSLLPNQKLAIPHNLFFARRVPQPDIEP